MGIETREFKNTNEFISLLGFGGCRLPTHKNERNVWEVDKIKLEEMIDYAMQHGINYFDTAYYYYDGASESYFGEILSKYPRNKYNIVTKMPLWKFESEDELNNIFNEQLKRCRVDFFDFYLMQAICADSILNIEKYNIHEYLKNKQKEGIIRHLGFSFHDKPDLLRTAVERYAPEFVLIQLNYLDWQLQDAKTQYQILKDNKIPVSVMEPVRGGILATLCEKSRKIFIEANPNASTASWALRYSASFPEVFTVLSGMSNMEQLKDNVNTFENFKFLDDSERLVINNALTVYKKLLKVPCTACRYCMDCPHGVDIPGIFNAFNYYYQQGQNIKTSMDRFLERYDYIEKNKQAHACIRCKICVKKCPQHINIPYWLKKVHNLYIRSKLIYQMYIVITRPIIKIKKVGIINMLKYYWRKYVKGQKNEQA